MLLVLLELMLFADKVEFGEPVEISFGTLMAR